MIGIIATIIGCIIHIEGLDANSIIQAVVTALGGIGTATVLYDAKINNLIQEQISCNFKILEEK